MTFILDTNLVSELRKVRAGKADAAMAAWAAGVPSAQLFLSATTIHELEHGVLLAERVDPPKGAVLRRWLDDSVTDAFDQRVLAVDAAIARRAAALHVPDPAPSVLFANGMEAVGILLGDERAQLRRRTWSSMRLSGSSSGLPG